MLPTLSEIEAASEQVYAALSPTAQLCWPLLCEQTGATVWVKHENHTAIGAFKVRGGLVYMDDLKRSQTTVNGVISATRGNHGQSIAFAAAGHDIHALIVAPRGNSKEKNAAMRAFGAELIEHGEDFNESADYAQTLAAERGLHMIPSFHPLLLRGVASYWLELMCAVPDLDAVYVPIGLGSGICAGIAVRNALRLRTQLIGVVSSAAPAYALSFAQGKAIEQPSETVIADGVAVRRPDNDALALILKHVERVVSVSDVEVKQAMRIYFSATHNIAEGAGAAPLAALLQERAQMQGKKVALVLSGGNVDKDVFVNVLQG